MNALMPIIESILPYFSEIKKASYTQKRPIGEPVSVDIVKKELEKGEPYIGYINPKSPLFVFDFDKNHDTNIVKKVENLKKNFPTVYKQYANNWFVSTPSGGLHVYVKIPSYIKIQSKTRKINALEKSEDIAGIDILGKAWLMLPNSKVEKGEYKIQFKNNQILELTEDEIKKLIELKALTIETYINKNEKKKSILERIKRMEQTIYKEGERNEALCKYAGLLSYVEPTKEGFEEKLRKFAKNNLTNYLSEHNFENQLPHFLKYWEFNSEKRAKYLQKKRKKKNGKNEYGKKYLYKQFLQEYSDKAYNTNIQFGLDKPIFVYVSGMGLTRLYYNKEKGIETVKVQPVKNKDEIATVLLGSDVLEHEKYEYIRQHLSTYIVDKFCIDWIETRLTPVLETEGRIIKKEDKKVLNNGAFAIELKKKALEIINGKNIVDFDRSTIDFLIDKSRPILEYMTNFIPNNIIYAEEIIKWFSIGANDFAEPLPAIVLLSHTRGTGKTTFAETVIGGLFGKNFYSGPLEKIVSSGFNGILKDKSLLIINELDVENTDKTNEALKRIITEKTHIINEKYKPEYERKGFYRLFFTVNIEPTVAEELDRFILLEVDNLQEKIPYKNIVREYEEALPYFIVLLRWVFERINKDKQKFYKGGRFFVNTEIFIELYKQTQKRFLVNSLKANYYDMIFSIESILLGMGITENIGVVEVPFTNFYNTLKEKVSKFYTQRSLITWIRTHGGKYGFYIKNERIGNSRKRVLNIDFDIINELKDNETRIQKISMEALKETFYIFY